MVTVEISSDFSGFVPVVGKVDTGAFRTILNFDTARILGIQDPKAVSPERRKEAYSATGDRLEYYLHPAMIQIAEGEAEKITFPLCVGFAEQVKSNLFGVDWLTYLCLAVDSEAVHFLDD